jgi:hypothetical protein
MGSHALEALGKLNSTHLGHVGVGQDKVDLRRRSKNGDRLLAI